jgi:hypothetical protein
MLKDVPTVYIKSLLLLNPDATSFPLGGHEYGAEISRAVLQTAVATRAPIDHAVFGLHAIKTKK